MTAGRKPLPTALKLVKGNKRHYGCANPEKFEVVELAVMPVAVAHRIIAAIPEAA